MTSSPINTALNNLVFIYDKVYIPEALVLDKTLFNKHWEFPVFDESLCRSCDNRKFRVNAQCRVCPGLKRIIRMWGTKQGNNGVLYYTVPAGQITEVFRKLNINTASINIEDRRCNKPFSHDLHFTGSLHTGQEVNGIATANQQYLVNKWLEVGSGLIEAPPRTGKTVIGTYLSCTLQRKTIITAHQEELLVNFYKTYENMTNLPELRRVTGKEIVKIITKIEDLDKEDYDVILINYQKFIQKESSDERINKYLKNKCSFVIVDECHQSAAECFSRFLNKLAPRYALGLSATPKRKDCISAETLIHTEEGLMTVEAIVKRIKEGKALRVFSQNPLTKEVELKSVLEVHEQFHSSYQDILLHNQATIKCSLDHELY